MPYPGGSKQPMKKITLFFFINLLFLFSFNGHSFIGNLSNAHAQQDWKQEYADICAKTQNAMGLSEADLKDYIDRCDNLQERIGELDGAKGETERKVYTKRLKMCRDLYVFALNYKEENK